MRYAFILLLFLTGCSSLTDRETAQYMLPVNIVGGYFGTVAWHEGGHAITAEALGGQNTRVSIWPSRDDNGDFHLGLTTTRFENPPSDLEETLFNVMGPTAAWVGHIGSRGLLRSGVIPRRLQPTIAWFGVMNQLGFYGHTIFGLARLKHTDLGKEDIWISATMFIGGLSIDLIDFITDKPDRYFGILIGEEFYGEDEQRFGTIAAPSKNGGFFGFWFNW